MLETRFRMAPLNVVPVYGSDVLKSMLLTPRYRAVGQGVQEAAVKIVHFPRALILFRDK